jgi:hypothetical protein
MSNNLSYCAATRTPAVVIEHLPGFDAEQTAAIEGVGYLHLFLRRFSRLASHGFNR